MNIEIALAVVTSDTAQLERFIERRNGFLDALLLGREHSGRGQSLTRPAVQPCGRGGESRSERLALFMMGYACDSPDCCSDFPTLTQGIA
jgi:hypothetical protein